jgi:Flp pilus assembly protein CpaB
MRASTIFALIVAVLLGLGVAVAVKASGYFDRAPETKQGPPPPQILVAATNIFEGHLLQATDVKLRPATPREREDLARNPDRYLPGMTQAAVHRQARINIEADRPIRREDLEELSLPTSLNSRLSRGTRAVNVAALRQHCAGGLIRVGDWVDVQLTTTIEAGTSKGVAPVTRTAIIARNLPVIARRNSLWPISTPLGGSCPLNFTLEANPYRAALIEFAKDKGVLSLLPVGQAEKAVLEARREESLRNPNSSLPVSFAIPDSAEYRDEDKRVADFNKGTITIGEADLARIFDLRYQPPPAAPEPILVERVSGVRLAGEHRFIAHRAVGPHPSAGGRSDDDGPFSSDEPAGNPLGVAGQITSAGGGSSSPFHFRPPDAACKPAAKKG